MLSSFCTSRDVGFEMTGETSHLKTRVNIGLLMRALENAVKNAAEATAAGGSVQVNVERAQERSPEDGDVSPRMWAVISVTDMGHGMDEETKRRALEPFFTTKGAKGTGLGLPMIKGFAEKSGGKFELESDVGKGTTVRIYLPILEGQA
jgi:signal transduction histidine kinase